MEMSGVDTSPLLGSPVMDPFQGDGNVVTRTQVDENTNKENANTTDEEEAQHPSLELTKATGTADSSDEEESQDHGSLDIPVPPLVLLSVWMFWAMSLYDTLFSSWAPTKVCWVRFVMRVAPGVFYLYSGDPLERAIRSIRRDYPNHFCPPCFRVGITLVHLGFIGLFVNAQYLAQVICHSGTMATNTNLVSFINTLHLFFLAGIGLCATSFGPRFNGISALGCMASILLLLFLFLYVRPVPEDEHDLSLLVLRTAPLLGNPHLLVLLYGLPLSTCYWLGFAMLTWQACRVLDAATSTTRGNGPSSLMFAGWAVFQLSSCTYWFVLVASSSSSYSWNVGTMLYWRFSREIFFGATVGIGILEYLVLMYPQPPQEDEPEKHSTTPRCGVTDDGVVSSRL